MYRNVVDSLYIGLGVKANRLVIATLFPLTKRGYFQTWVRRWEKET